MSHTGSIDASLDPLHAAAREVAQRAYAPYSKFRVGAALQLSNGAVVTGTNVENVSYGMTICAERAAIARAIAEYGPQIRITAVAIANLNDAPSPPCGACRQMLAEFIAPEAPIVFPSADGVRCMRFEQLLPMAFFLETK